MRQKLFTKQIDDMLFKQYAMGNDLSKQKVVAKIFNPYGRGVWYLVNSDPQDPDYIWAIVDLFEAEVGSVSREDLETIKVPPFGLNLERDIYFQPINAQELLERVMQGERFADGGTTDLQIVKNEQQENFLTTDNPSPNGMAIKLADGGMMAKGGTIKEEDYFLVLKGMKIKRFRVFSIDGDDVKINYSLDVSPFSSVTTQMSLNDMKWMLKNGYIKKTNEKEYWKDEYKNTSQSTFADGGMMGVSGEVDGEYVAINVDNSGGGMFENGGMPSIGGTSFSDVDLSVSNLNTSFKSGGVMEKSDLEGLIGLTFQLDLEGNGGSSEHKIEDIRVTPPSFRHRDLFIMTSDGSEDRIPMSMVDDFLNNEQINLKDSKGDSYAITLIDLFEPKVVRTQFEEEEFEFGDGGAIKGSNPKSGEKYGVVIGSKQKSDEYTDGGTEMNVRKSYGSRISEVKLVFDSKGNLHTIIDYGSSIDGYPSTSHGSGTTYNADKKETLKLLSEKYNPSFAKKLIESVSIKMANGGETSGMETINYLKSMSGLRASYLAEWGDKNNVDLGQVAKAIKTKKLKAIDLSTAVSGRDGNKYAKDIIAKYGHKKMARGGKTTLKDKVSAMKSKMAKKKR